MGKSVCTAAVFMAVIASVVAWNAVQVTEFSRHGARTGSLLFPNSSVPEEVALGHKQLTGNGRAQHYLIGLYLKKKYPLVFGAEKDNIKRSDVEAF